MGGRGGGQEMGDRGAGQAMGGRGGASTEVDNVDNVCDGADHLPAWEGAPPDIVHEASGSTMVYPWGVEKGLLESVSTAQSKHGATKDNKFRTWIDCIQEQKLGDGVYMVTWHAWQMSEGSERQGYFATAILREKEGTPNGVEWLGVHETSRKS